MHNLEVLTVKKITVEFKKLTDIRKLKTIMKNVYSSKSDHLPDITRFNLNKIFSPNSVERAEIHITTASSVDIVGIAKNSLTFFIGEFPFTKVSNNSSEEDKYTVLPWNLSNHVGQDNLKNLINRIKENTQNLKYIIFIKPDSTLHSSYNNLSQSMTSLAELNLSDIVAEDNTEGLLNKIEELELKISDLRMLLSKAQQDLELEKNLVSQKQQELDKKQQEINNLNNQIIALSKNEITWDTREKNKASFQFAGFTGTLNTIIDPISGTMSFNVS